MIIVDFITSMFEIMDPARKHAPMPLFPFSFPKLFGSPLYSLYFASSQHFIFPVLIWLLLLFPFFHQVPVKYLYSKLFSAFFFMSLLNYRSYLLFMKRPNKKSFSIIFFPLLLTWTRNLRRNFWILLTNCRLRKT